jgi:hypothetical protein
MRSPGLRGPVLSHGREINVILFDGRDIDNALDPRYSLRQVLEVKVRRAAQRGEPYYAFQRHLDEPVA